MKLKDDGTGSGLHGGLGLGDGVESFSLSTSPGAHASGSHTPTGLLAFTQHMHGLTTRGAHAMHGLNMTAFSLPLANYTHTAFSPASASPSDIRHSFSHALGGLMLPGGAGGILMPGGVIGVNGDLSSSSLVTDPLTFAKETPLGAHPPSSGLAAALAPNAAAAAAAAAAMQMQLQQAASASSAPPPR